jgi:2-oxoisovalerate dehydrogenase E1 component
MKVDWLHIFSRMLLSRQIDGNELELVNRGGAFFHVSGAGHEATAALARHLTGADYLHCHYRDKALMLARGLAPVQFFGSLLCNADTPILKRRPRANHVIAASAGPRLVGLSRIYAVEGNAAVTNKDLAARFADMTPEGILSRSGIERRSVVSNGQTALSMAVEAASKALREEKLRLNDIDLIICSTSTPPMISPSLACLILHELALEHGEAEVQAYDVMAACTGYLYALGIAWDHLQACPDSTVLVITAEEMSRAVDPHDFGTAILFGDAATATVLHGPGRIEKAKAHLHRPVLSARGERGDVLRVPLAVDREFVHMDGKKVFTEAVRQMTTILERACRESSIAVDDLDLIIPHQANGRIIEAVQARLKCAPERVCNDVMNHGNTSSSTIPLALSKVLERPLPQRIGLCAFGAGFTFGAAIAEIP